MLSALWFFAITHVDTLVVISAFCTDERYELLEVFVGHYLGFGIGLTGALVGAWVAAGAFEESSFLLGVIPLTLGVWGFVTVDTRIKPIQPDVIPSRLSRVGTVTVAGVGLSGENIAVFLPFFLTLSEGELAVVLVSYVVAAAVVFLFAVWIARRAVTFNIPRWVETHLVPATLVLVGSYVLLAGWLAVA